MDSSIKRSVIEDAWLALCQLIGEHEHAGQDVRHLREIEQDLRTALDLDGLRQAS